MMNPTAWTESEKLLFAASRLRSAAVRALEQRFADPDNPALSDTLDSLIRDVAEAERAYRASQVGGHDAR